MSAAVMTPAMAGADFLASLKQLVARHDGADTVEELQKVADDTAALLRKVRSRITRISKTTKGGSTDGQEQGQGPGRAEAATAGSTGGLREVDGRGAATRAGVAAEGPIRRLDPRQGLSPAWEPEQPAVNQLQVLELPWPASAWLVNAQIACGRETGDVVAVGASDAAGAVAARAQDASGRPGEHDPEATATLPAVDSGQSGALERERWVDERAEEKTVELPPLSAEPLAAGMGRHRYVRGDLTVWELVGWGRRRRVAPLVFWTAIAFVVVSLLVAAWFLVAKATGIILDTLPPDVGMPDPVAATTVAVPLPGGGR